MDKVLHLPDGDKKVMDPEKEAAQKAAQDRKETQFRGWIEQAEPHEASFVDWSAISSDEEAQRVMDMVAEFTTAFLTARVLHHSAATSTPPAAVGISIQIMTFNEDEEPLEDVEVDLSQPKE
jgi:hypothetical protein